MIASTDVQLIAQINAGSARAFGELYDRYCGRAAHVAMSVCRDPEHAEAAVRDAFLSVWKTSSTYREERGSVAVWLLSIVCRHGIAVGRSEEGHASLPGLLDLLPDDQREVIALAFYGGLSHTEIAAQLDLSSGTVKGRMRLGLTKLRAHAASAG